MFPISNLVATPATHKLDGARTREAVVPAGGRYSALYPHVLVDGQPWILYKGILTPFSLPHRSRPSSPQVIADAVSQYHSAGAIWTYDWDCQRTPWFYMVCDDPEYSIDK